MNARLVAQEIGRAAMQGPRIYFAPLLGAIRAVRSEFNRVNPSAMKKSTTCKAAQAPR